MHDALFDIPRPRCEVVYFATCGALIKIGRTERPVRRRGGELRVTMLHTLPGGAMLEREHHNRWAHLRIGSSEWFHPGEDLLLWLMTELVGAGHMRELGIVRHLAIDVRRVAA